MQLCCIPTHNVKNNAVKMRGLVFGCKQCERAATERATSNAMWLLRLGAACGPRPVLVFLFVQDKYSILEAWARSRWSSAQERVFQWSREVRSTATSFMCLKLHGAHRPMLRGCVYIYVVICGFALFRAEALRHPFHIAWFITCSSIQVLLSIE